MADINLFQQKYNQYMGTFKSTSYDSENNHNLCSDETQEVINFDKIIEDKYPDSNQRPKSFDALYVHKDLIFCIEFKNQKPSQINNQEIQEKLVSGKSELVNLLQDLNIQQNDYSFVYCVSYRKCIESRDRYKCGIDKGKTLFGLGKYVQEGIIKDVYTDNVAFFTKQFNKQFQKELAC